MIAYYDRRGQYLGQASAVPPNAPLVSLQPPVTPTIPVVTSQPESYAAAQDLAKLDDKVTLSKGAILVGALVLGALTLTLSSSLLRRR